MRPSSTYSLTKAEGINALTAAEVDVEGTEDGVVAVAAAEGVGVEAFDAFALLAYLQFARNIIAMRLPGYYSSLVPFEQLFRTGLPVLTYHHVGRRTRGARLKGLYVSTKLFARQMAELREAGFATAEFGSGAPPVSSADGRIVLTFDDGFWDVFENALPILQRHRFCGIQFLVSDLIGRTNEWQQRAGDVSEPLMDEAQVREWLSAGQKIGSHTRTHPWLTRISREEAREEISGSKKRIEDRFGVAVEHFCYPYGDWNEAVRDLVIAAGYKTACTTKAGVNTAESSRFELKRFTARYRSRNLKAIWARLRGGGKNRTD